MRRQNGFTLIELMIVIAIIGTLAAIALPAYRDYVLISHGGSSMKGVTAFVGKVTTCVNAGIDCDGVVTELALYGELTADSFTGGGDAFADSMGGDLHWNDGVCIATASISAAGVVSYSASAVDGGEIDALCQEGAGVD